MLKTLSRRVLAHLGYEIRRIPPEAKGLGQRIETPNFTLYRYVKPDGSFDYERYRQVQIEGNKRKLDVVGVAEENIAFLSNYIKREIPSPSFGICHGTRRGVEQNWFRKYLDCHVIGTEISDTARQFPHTIQWDFHEVKPEWLGRTDFIYSNAFDHSYDPKKCLDAWMSCLTSSGFCFLEHGSTHGPSGASGLDPFGADLVQMAYLITIWGAGQYGLREIIAAPARVSAADDLHFLVIRPF